MFLGRTGRSRSARLDPLPDTGLDEAQKSVIDLVDTANARMRKIKEMAQFIDLVADLLLLATATYAAKPRPIIAALKEVRRDVEALTGKA